MDFAIKIIKDVGEVGIDTEASPGNGKFYAKLYDGSFDECGFDSFEEALAELEFCIN